MGAPLPLRLTSECVHEVDEIMLFQLGQPNVESVVVEVHDLQQRRSRTIVEIRLVRRQRAQARNGNLADVTALSGDQGLAGIVGRHTRPSRVPEQSAGRAAGEFEDRQVRCRWWPVEGVPGSMPTDPNVTLGIRQEVTAGIGHIVAG